MEHIKYRGLTAFVIFCHVQVFIRARKSKTGRVFLGFFILSALSASCNHKAVRFTVSSMAGTRHVKQGSYIRLGNITHITLVLFFRDGTPLDISPLREQRGWTDGTDRHLGSASALAKVQCIFIEMTDTFFFFCWQGSMLISNITGQTKCSGHSRQTWERRAAQTVIYSIKAKLGKNICPLFFVS